MCTGVKWGQFNRCLLSLGNIHLWVVPFWNYKNKRNDVSGFPLNCYLPLCSRDASRTDISLELIAYHSQRRRDLVNCRRILSGNCQVIFAWE